MPKPDRLLCACVASDPYECWARRYAVPPWKYEELENDGGPCECACHDDHEDEWYSYIDGAER